MDWLKVISEQRDIAQAMAREIPPVLSSDTADKNHLERLWNMLDRLCIQMEELVENLQDVGVDEALISAAMSVEEVFLELQVAVGEKLVKLWSPR